MATKDNTKQTKEWTTEDILNAAKQGLDSDAWKTMMKVAPAKLGKESAALRAAIASGEMVVQYQKPKSANYTTNRNDMRDDALYIPRGEGNTMFNRNGSVLLDKNGTVSLAGSTFNKVRLNPDGQTEITATTITTQTNSFSLDTDDLIVNNHKLNNKLYELADFKRVLNTYDGSAYVAGGLTMLGTVLVRAWEPNLQRYVLVRRQINIPVFSPAMGGIEVHPGIDITSDVSDLKSIREKLNMAGFKSPADMFSEVASLRQQAVTVQEAKTAAANEATRKANAQKQATSMTDLTGQNPGTTPASVVANGTMSNGVANGNNTAPSAKPSVDGWDSANNRPNDTETYWYKVSCKAQTFQVMKGHNVIETWPCNTSNFGSTSNKVKGDNKTPIGIFKLATVEKNNMAADKLTSGCKIKGAAGVFGPYYLNIDLGESLGTSCGIAVHGDYPSEDAKRILKVNAPAGIDAVVGQGSTHGCVRLYNADVTTLGTKYAKVGQYIKIEA